MATGSRDCTIILWDATNGAIAHQWIAHTYQAVDSLAFSPDSQYLASGGGDSKVEIWDLAEGLHKVATLEGHNHDVTHCAWSPRGDTIASTSGNSIVRLWDARTFRPLHVLKHEDATNVLGLIVFSPDGRWLVSGYSSFLPNLDYNIYYYIWNVTSGTLHKLMRGEPMSGHGSRPCIAAAFGPASSRRLAVALDRSFVNLLDVENGEDLVTLVSVGNSRASYVAFSPDGMLVVTVSGGHTVTIWDAYTGITLFSLRGHKELVNWACFSPCGRYVASASNDRTVRLWRTRDGSCMGTFSEHNRRVNRVAFSVDGTTLWSGDQEGTVIMRRMRDIVPPDEQEPILTLMLSEL